MIIIVAKFNGIYLAISIAFTLALVVVAPETSYKFGAIMLLLLLLLALKNRESGNAYIIVTGALILHHWLLNGMVTYKSIDADSLTPFIIKASFIYAPVLPNPFVAIPIAATLVYHFFSYNDGTFSSLIGAKTFATLLTAITVSTGVWLFQRLTRERDKLYKASVRDDLTGLYTYTHAVELGQELLAQGNKVTVILLDLDDFKAINDTFGHLAGNKILKQFADSLCSVLPQNAIVARMGGDEFVAIIKEQDGKIVSREFVGRLKDKQYIVDAELAPIKVLFSHGIAVQSATSMTNIQELVNLADQNMYCNKTSRGIRVDINTIEAAAPEKFHDIINVMAQKDVYTYVHSLHVARYGAILAENIGMDADSIDSIFLAGWLHDLGKIAIPNEILRKPGKLADEEYHLIKSHVSYGINLLTTFDIGDSVGKAIANHHERCDGRGYPNGYLNHEIPIEGRILAIADAFSAMTVKRVYCDRLSEREALEELKRGKGLQFDPELVERFANIIESSNYNAKIVYN